MVSGANTDILGVKKKSFYYRYRLINTYVLHDVPRAVIKHF